MDPHSEMLLNIPTEEALATDCWVMKPSTAELYEFENQI